MRQDCEHRQIEEKRCTRGIRSQSEQHLQDAKHPFLQRELEIVHFALLTSQRRVLQQTRVHVREELQQRLR